MSQEAIQLFNFITANPHYTAKFMAGLGGFVVTAIAINSDRNISPMEWLGLLFCTCGWMADALL